MLIFLCSGAANIKHSKLSSKIAACLEDRQLGEVGSIHDLSAQKALPKDQQKNMIFINDCRSACVKMLMQGFDSSNYLFFDVSAFIGLENFNVEAYVTSQIIPVLNAQWANLS